MARQPSGSIVPVVTPFADDGSLDLDTFSSLVDWHARAGSDGVVVTGTSGEPSVLTVDERSELIRAAVAAASGRITVVAATGSQSLTDTMTLSTRAVDAGADALLVVTPYYIKPPQDGLVKYFEAVATRVDVPTLIYHIPSRAGVTMAPRSVSALRERVPSVVGMKHAGADLGYVSELLEVVGHDFSVFAGLEELGFPVLALGGAGVMNAVGNVAPGVVSELCAAVLDRGDLVRARELHYQLLELNRAIFWETNPIPIKYLMSRLGLIPVNTHRLPMTAASDELARRLDALLQRTPWLRGHERGDLQPAANTRAAS